MYDALYLEGNYIPTQVESIQPGINLQYIPKWQNNILIALHILPKWSSMH